MNWSPGHNNTDVWTHTVGTTLPVVTAAAAGTGGCTATAGLRPISPTCRHAATNQYWTDPHLNGWLGIRPILMYGDIGHIGVGDSQANTIFLAILFIIMICKIVIFTVSNI